MAGFDLATLSAFTKEDTRKPLFEAMYKEVGAMARECNIYAGIKSSVKLPTISQSLVLQTGGTCAVNASGDTTIAQKTLTVNHVKVDLEWCPSDLKPYFTQAWLKQGAMETELPTFLTEFFLQKLKEEIILRDAYGTVAANKYVGWASAVETAGGYNSITPQASVTTSNFISIVDDFFQNQVDEISAVPKRLFVGMEDYRIGVTAYKNANYFNNGDFNAASQGMEFMAPGTNFMITADPGLSAARNGKHRMYLLDPKNIWLGVDGTGDDEMIDLWFDQNTRKIKARVEFSRGYQVMFASEVVRYSNF